MLAGSNAFAEGGTASLILEPKDDPIYQLSGMYADSGSFSNSRASSVFEMGAKHKFAYFRDVLSGDLDIGLSGTFLTFLDDPHLPNLPESLLKVSLDAGMAWQFDNGNALQLRAYPGLYSEPDAMADGWKIPFSVALLKEFHPDVCGMLGVEIRPDFEDKWIPLFGVVWQASDVLKIDLRIPKSRATLFISQYVWVYFGYEWRNISYELNEPSGGVPHRVTLEDERTCAGLLLKVSDEFHVAGEVGRLFDRQVKAGSESDIGDANFFRLVFGGAF